MENLKKFLGEVGRVLKSDNLSSEEIVAQLGLLVMHGSGKDKWDEIIVEVEHWFPNKNKRREICRAITSLARRGYIEGIGQKDLDRLRFSLEFEKGYVYFLRAYSGHYKIGKAKKLDERIKVLEIQLPFPLELKLAFFTEHAGYLEKYLHEFYRDKRLSGEWFSLSDEDIKFLKSWGDGEFDESWPVLSSPPEDEPMFNLGFWKKELEKELREREWVISYEN